MIKKLNTFVFVLIGVLVVAKAVLNSSKASSDVGADDGAPPAVVRNAEFAPTLHYFTLPGLSLANPMLNRNGYLLDVVRAVFPNVCFDDIGDPNFEVWRNQMGGEGDNIAIVTKEIGELMGATTSDVVLYNQQLVIYSLRHNDWIYDGPESLLRLKRLGVREDLLLAAGVQGLLGKVSDRLRVYKRGEDGHARLSQVLLSGEVDAYFVQRQSSLLSRTEEWGVTGDSLMNLRCSPPVLELPFVLGVKSSDPERVKKMIEAFDRGYREIEQSGELRRIREYYER